MKDRKNSAMANNEKQPQQQTNRCGFEKLGTQTPERFESKEGSKNQRKASRPQKALRTTLPQNRLILPDLTAIGLRLSHASRTPQATVGRGERLSNTLSIYPQDGDNLGKLRLIPDRGHRLEWCVLQKTPMPRSLVSPEDETASD